MVMSDFERHLEIRAERLASLKEWIVTRFPPDEGLCLELGCGHGHWLTAYAEKYPDRYCLGVDLISHRIRKATEKGAKRSLDRLFFLKADVFELLEAWPNHRPLEAVFMLFPDPWPKKRHHKNRMIQEKVLSRLSELARPGARFCFRTDHEAMFEWTMTAFKEHPNWQMDPAVPWPLENSTFFQELMDSWKSLIAVRRD